MSREEARAKGWDTFRENMKKFADGNQQFLDEFMLDRLFTAYLSWRNARIAERKRDFRRARILYTKAVESIEQAEKLSEEPAAIAYVNNLKAAYYDFAVHRDPDYRLYLKHPLLWIKDHPGMLQTDLYKRFSTLKRDDLSYVLYFAEKEGLISREEKGRSYQLFFIRDKEGEPFLKLEDDEIDIQERIQKEEEQKKGCLFLFTIAFWFIALVVGFAIKELIGAGIVAAAFVVWLVVRKIRLKKKQSEEAVPPVPVPPALPDTSDQNEGDG